MPDGATLLAKPALTLERHIGAPPHEVFAAWTDPRRLGAWFGPKGAEAVTAEIDARVGGRYRIGFRSRDGEAHEIGGVYLELLRDEKLAFTWAWRTTPERESLVTVRLAGDAGGTLLTLTHERFFDEAARDRHYGGWTVALDKLAALFA